MERCGTGYCLQQFEHDSELSCWVGWEAVLPAAASSIKPVNAKTRRGKPQPKWILTQRREQAKAQRRRQNDGRQNDEEKGMLRLYQKFCRKCAILRDSTATRRS